MTATFIEVLRLFRPRNATLPALAFTISYLLYSTTVSYAIICEALFIIFLAHSIATFQNDQQDIEIDKLNKRKSALLSGKVSTKDSDIIVTVLYILLAVVIGFSGEVLVNTAFAWSFVALAYAYNYRPLLLSRRPVASIILLGLTMGFIPAIYGWCSTGSALSNGPILLALSFFAIRSSTSILKDYKDVVGDKKSEKRTFLIIFGRQKTYVWSVSLAIIGYGVLMYSLVHITSASTLTIGILATVFICLVFSRLWLKGVKNYASLSERFKQITMLTIISEIGVVLWLLY